jgi:MFS family permease
MTAILALACGLLMLLAPSQFLATAGLILWQMLVLGVTTPNYAALLSIVPSAMRGTVTALLMLGTNLVGLGGAPTVVGILSDLMGGGLALRQALVIVLCFAVPAALLFARSAVQLRRESARRAAVGA